MKTSLDLLLRCDAHVTDAHVTDAHVTAVPVTSASHPWERRHRRLLLYQRPSRRTTGRREGDMRETTQEYKQNDRQTKQCVQNAFFHPFIQRFPPVRESRRAKRRGWLMLLLYPVGVLVMYATLLAKDRGEQTILTSGYKGQYWWFEIFETTRRIALARVLGLIAPGSQVQLGAGLSMANVRLCVYYGCMPYTEIKVSHERSESHTRTDGNPHTRTLAHPHTSSVWRSVCTPFCSHRVCSRTYSSSGTAAGSGSRGSREAKTSSMLSGSRR